MINDLYRTSTKHKLSMNKFGLHFGGCYFLYSSPFDKITTRAEITDERALHG